MITFITSNKHKVLEAKGIFEEFGIEVKQADLGYPELQGTLEEVAKYGAMYAAKLLKEPVIVEDAGLFIRALKWFPGPYSAYVQETIGNNGILKLMEGLYDRYAEFRSVVGYCAPDTEPETFLGVVKGKIGFREKGNKGFAFDPIFYPLGKNKTFGELTREEKNKISHRSKSLKKFAKWYRKRGDLR